MVAIRIREWSPLVQHQRTARDKVSGAISHPFCPKCTAFGLSQGTVSAASWAQKLEQVWSRVQSQQPLQKEKSSPKGPDEAISQAARPVTDCPKVTTGRRKSERRGHQLTAEADVRTL